MTRGAIIQEYIPQYRLPFFSQLEGQCSRMGIELVVASGRPSSELADRRDDAELPFGVTIPQREYRLAARRLTVRSTSSVVAEAGLIILEQARRNVDTYASLLRRGRRRQVVALWGHGKDYTQETASFDRALQRWLTSQADWFFAYTQGGADAVVSEGYPEDRVTVVQNAMDGSALKGAVEAVREAESEHFEQTHDLRGKTALFIGGLDGSKRLEFLREAASMAHEWDSDIRLLIGGDGPMRAEVEGWAGSHDWLTYLGPLSGREKAIAGKAAQILAIPGRVGLVAVDSFAIQAPIVTTSWPYHAPEYEYLAHGVNSLTSQNSVTAYAEVLHKSLGNERLRAELRSGCSAASEIYTIDAMCERFCEGIVSALEAGRR